MWKEHCNMRYIGQTKRALKYRLAEHRIYVNNNIVDTFYNGLNKKKWGRGGRPLIVCHILFKYTYIFLTHSF